MMITRHNKEVRKSGIISTKEAEDKRISERTGFLSAIAAGAKLTEIESRDL